MHEDERVMLTMCVACVAWVTMRMAVKEERRRRGGGEEEGQEEEEEKKERESPNSKNPTQRCGEKTWGTVAAPALIVRSRRISPPRAATTTRERISRIPLNPKP